MIKVDYRPRFTDRFYLPALAKGYLITLANLLRRRVTLRYPEQKHTVPTNYHGLHKLTRDEKGRIKCVACEMCAAACPASCIQITAREVDWGDRDKAPVVFDIDELRCIFCGYCVEACPEKAIVMTAEHHFAYMERSDFVYGKDELLATPHRVTYGYEPGEGPPQPRDPVRPIRGS
jgi:NADH-quinone oxidoreductase subunit I